MKRVAAELKNLADKFDIDTPDPDDLMHWKLSIKGPMGTPYENGIFVIDVKFPDNYPFAGPKVQMDTKIFHPNISSKGNVCIRLDEWSPKKTIEKGVLMPLIELLTTPDLENPSHPEAANLASTDPEKFDESAREWTRQFAS